jgi:tRNA-2-methylthio-N6-dimethylallyladenosine synthase
VSCARAPEDKALNRLYLLRELKEKQPDKIIGVMGCMVGVRDPLALRKKLPFVDVFMAPSTPDPLVDFLRSRAGETEILEREAWARARRDAIQDGELILPEHEIGKLVSAHVPVVYGCSHACTFCVILSGVAWRAPQRGRDCGAREQSGAAGCQGDHAAGADR